ncbi:hypothetical protein SAMN05216374_3159 [Tardiphaga sp. OK246]|nr:hypothetical protein [Tardiphaga sp. OK246]SNT32227.1 hypothetical protein SAMN05216374_3159 [Tardiphaga sp. OK246]
MEAFRRGLNVVVAMLVCLTFALVLIYKNDGKTPDHFEPAVNAPREAAPQ